MLIAFPPAFLPKKCHLPISPIAYSSPKSAALLTNSSPFSYFSELDNSHALGAYVSIYAFPYKKVLNASPASCFFLILANALANMILSFTLIATCVIKVTYIYFAYVSLLSLINFQIKVKSFF